jgi:4-hydroxy-3-polyprenylbenzoate decarboxylase
MPGIKFHTFISNLDSEFELLCIKTPVDPILEIAVITDRICKQADGGKALLFENPSGSNFKVVTNLFGSRRRACQALGIDNLDCLTERMTALLDLIPEIDFEHLDKQIAALPEFSVYAPNLSTQPDPELLPMNPPDLTMFPFLQCWPEDGSVSGNARYITLPQVFSVDPDGGSPNCGLYRIQVLGTRELGIQWKAGSGAACHAELFRKAGKPMPVAIALGGEPAMLFSAMFPLPGALDEVTFAGFLRGSSLPMAPCLSVPLTTSTGAEVVIEGYVQLGESVIEGPFGNHSGFYSPAAEAALLRVTAIRHRVDAVIPATVVGSPPMEDCWMSKAWERLLLAFIRTLAPEIKDIHFPDEWVFHQSAIISLENAQPGMVSGISRRLWPLPWFTSSRVLIFVAAEAEYEKLSHTAWRCINVVDYTQDVIYDKTTQRIAVDATGCRSLRKPATMSEEIIQKVDLRWREYGLG